MALVIHRCPGVLPRDPKPRLLLLGGDGRWARPLLRLVEGLGFAPSWTERYDHPEVEIASGYDLVIAASVDVAAGVVDRCKQPVIVLTGSLLGLSTPIPNGFRPLAFPLTLSSLSSALSGARCAGSEARIDTSIA